MTPTQLRSEQTLYGLSDKDFAKLVGVGGGRTVRGWKQGRNPVPGPVVHLLWMLRQATPILRDTAIKKFMGK